MQHQLELGHLAIEVPDPTVVTFAIADVVGQAAGDPTPSGALTSRDDDRSQRLVVRDGPSGDRAELTTHVLARISGAGPPRPLGDPRPARRRGPDHPRLTPETNLLHR